MTAPLPERLRDVTRTPDGTDLPDHAEPWSADCATLREAADALHAAQALEHAATAVVTAFQALGQSPSAASDVLLRLECERAMVDLNACIPTPPQEKK